MQLNEPRIGEIPEGSILSVMVGSRLYALWEECVNMLTTSTDDKPISQDEYMRCVRIIMQIENRIIHDYNRPCGRSLRRTADNYKKREFKPPMLEKMKPWYQETFDPLVRLNRKGQPREEKDSYTFKDMAEEVTLIKEKHEDEANLELGKIFFRCMYLYLVSELIMGNFVHSQDVTPDKVFFSWDDLNWFVTMYHMLVIDPPRSRQLPLDQFRELFHRFVKEIMKLLEAGKPGIGDTWFNARTHLLDKRWGSEWEVKPPPCKSQLPKENTVQPKATVTRTPKGQKRQWDNQDDESTPDPKRRKGKGDKGGGKGAASGGQNLPRSPAAVKSAKYDAANIKNKRLIKTSSGKFYCKCKNDGKVCFNGTGVWHDRKCPDIHECSHVDCTRRQNCPGAYSHK